ncbi:MAG: DinB family protein [Chthonomonadales bacterium]
MLPSATRTYLVHGLRATPIVVEHLTQGLDDAVLDRRPDAERFTIREVLAHLADFEVVWLERMRRMASEAEPFLPGVDESELAAAHDYAHSDPEVQRDRFCRGRDALVGFLEALSPEEWDRTGRRETGIITIGSLAAMVLGHDGYHTRQIVEWMRG